VGVTATREPLSLCALPVDRVCRLAGVTPEQLAVALDPPPPGAPVLLRCPAPPASAAVVVDSMLDRLETIAREVFPAWLPEAGLLDSTSDHDRRVVRLLAHRRASSSAHFGPFLAALAEAALTGSVCAVEFDAATRARGLVRIIEDAYGRDSVVVYAEVATGLDAAAQHQIAAALQWLVDHGRLGVWLAATALPEVDRVATETLTPPPSVTELDPPSTATATAAYPAPIGRPHPASAAEQALERHLARCDWATGRQWNQVRSGHPLVPLIRVDLMWPDARCVVEIDGADHRGALKYAADRRRDNALALDGFVVLRFTNDEVVDDPVRVLATIEALLSAKRRQKGELS
jgi:very-short-patch-repair endonuclease